jgi:hypothetical protein
MPADARLTAENTRQRERLRALVDRLSDADLERPLGHGWTVAAALVHLAFWDLRAVALMDRYERDGKVTASAAEAVDRRIERLGEATLAAVAAAGPPFRPDRHLHRAEHLDEIDRALR